MSGNSLLVDTNMLIYLFKGNERVYELLYERDLWVSFITEMELLSFDGHTSGEILTIKRFLSNFFIRPWYLTLLFFFTSHFIAGVLLSLIFQTAHVMTDSAYPLPDENGTMKNNWVVHQLMVTSDYAINNKLLKWFVGGLN